MREVRTARVHGEGDVSDRRGRVPQILGVIRGGRIERSRVGRRQRDDMEGALRRCRWRVGRERRLAHDDVRVGATESERADAG